ncbi:Spondin-1 [Desmophyllum pertusum]|uniref:Spondin-1 n=1 Tax=Desmophyllum pertusum TaxID=174260 RepID=A0A9X0CY26_9CNID|nr:Spondin-1 [Desmophyllum pertusum]
MAHFRPTRRSAFRAQIKYAAKIAVIGCTCRFLVFGWAAFSVMTSPALRLNTPPAYNVPSPPPEVCGCIIVNGIVVHLNIDSSTGMVVKLCVDVVPSRGGHSQFFRPVYSNVKCPGKAEYELSVYYMWSNTSHPNAVPINGANFSPLVGCSHNSGYTMFEAGIKATEGVKYVAETGNATTLKYEIMKQMMYSKTTWKTFEASGKVNGGTAHVSGLKVYATADYYMVSAIAMMVPSPDWFVGVAGVSLCDNGMWKETAEAMSQPWDAGTKNGSMF